jgi:hypothetical protein
VSDIVWEEPPVKKRGKSGASPEWVGRLAPMRSRPGTWANLGRFSASTVTHLRQGHYAGTTPGEYEAEGRDFDRSKNTVTLYVRYVGSGDAGAPSATAEESGK